MGEYLDCGWTSVIESVASQLGHLVSRSFRYYAKHSGSRSLDAALEPSKTMGDLGISRVRVRTSRIYDRGTASSYFDLDTGEHTSCALSCVPHTGIGRWLARLERRHPVEMSQCGMSSAPGRCATPSQTADKNAAIMNGIPPRGSATAYVCMYCRIARSHHARHLTSGYSSHLISSQ